MTRALFTFVILAVATAVAWPLSLDATSQRRVTLTLAHMAPSGSQWDIQLKEMGADWQDASGGAVRLNVAPGGRSGTECAVVTQLRAGTRPEAAALTTGLSCLDRGFSVFSVPFLFESLDEAFAVAEALEPLLASRLEAQGISLIAWGLGGWVHIFGSERIANVDDLKAAKLFTTAGENVAENWYRSHGFTPVPLTLLDVPTALASGTIEAVPVPPYLALVSDYYRDATYMLDVPITPIIGAIVVNTRAWERIAADVRPQLVEQARAMGQRLREIIPAQDREAVSEMQARGLQVVAPDAGFRDASEPLIASMRGTWVPEDVYDLALTARAAYRAGGGR